MLRAARNTLLLLTLAACATAPAGDVGDDHLEVARRVLSTTPLVDGHNDLPWAIRGYDAAPGDVAAYDIRGRVSGHTDIARLREGMVGAQFWSVYTSAGSVREGAAKVQLEQIDI
ncbi:MAG TPA: membrane dipeptidase, partial [Longimicrobiaceae bacterium]|nr:membrane dipeptidase [Longimicrobiaceae bacterium]